MLTKFYISIDGNKTEIPQSCIKNWDEIKCAYKRTDFDGVTRSFTSQFEFVGEMYDKLMSLYMERGVNATAILSLYTITNHWEWVEQFSCPIDFSSISWDNNTITLSCIDDSLAALIKSKKSTKFEFKVGSDIVPDNNFYYDRLPVLESITYEFTQGEQFENCADLMVEIARGENPYIGNVANETYINHAIEWNDDQTSEAGSFLFKPLADIEVKLQYEMSWRTDDGTIATNIGINVRRDGIDVPVITDPDNSQVAATLAIPGPIGLEYLGTFSNPGTLTSQHPTPKEKQWAKIGGKVWRAVYDGNTWSWEGTNKTPEEVFIGEGKGTRILTLQKGDEVYISASDHAAKFRVIKSKFNFSWLTRGKDVDIPVFKPGKIATAILQRIAGDETRIEVDISANDVRMANTYIIAAECARGITEAKFYSTFNEFCEWMSTVFGYVYYIGEVKPPQFSYVKTCGGYDTEDYEVKQGTYYGDINIDNIVYSTRLSCFFYRDTANKVKYYHWIGTPGVESDDYSGLDSHPRIDTLFIIKRISNTTRFCFEAYNGAPLSPIATYFDEKYLGKNSQTVYFVHRSELFSANAKVRKIEHCREINYGVDATCVYSSLDIGYEKKDYDSINGRDEYNFSNVYVTGCAVSDKKLSMRSKYRADCYGLEFTVQKRGADTTDNEADNDVFFVLAQSINGRLIPDRSIKIENALTKEVFNGAFSPIACVRANAGLIGMQSAELKLEFASSTGNSDIVIDGVAMSSNVLLDTPLMTCGTLQFTTNETKDPMRFNDIIAIESNGILYRGFVKDVSFRYARNEAVTYNLIIKDIQL